MLYLSPFKSLLGAVFQFNKNNRNCELFLLFFNARKFNREVRHSSAHVMPLLVRKKNPYLYLCQSLAPVFSQQRKIFQATKGSVVWNKTTQLKTPWEYFQSDQYVTLVTYRVSLKWLCDSYFYRHVKKASIILGILCTFCLHARAKL